MNAATEAVITLASLQELAEKIREMSSDTDRYFLRFVELCTVAKLSFDDAELILFQEVSVFDCQRLAQSGGEMWEIDGLVDTISKQSRLITSDQEKKILADFVDQRCEFDKSYREALGVIYMKYDIVDEDYEW